MLVERDMKKTEFAKKAKISSASLAKLGKGANATTDILVKGSFLTEPKVKGR